MELCLYAHPWDLQALGRHGGLARLRDLGFGEVALAVSYHAGRWLTPWGQEGMVRFLEDGTVHFRPRLEDYGELRPLASREVPAAGPSPLEQLAQDAAPLGLRVRAWAVLYHNTRLGELHLESCVRNAFGDRYTYALCPARPEVQRYGEALVADVARHGGVQSIEFEALGWQGHRHNSHHDKSSFPADPYTDFLLSQCFCASCCGGMGEAAAQAKASVDVAALPAQVRQLLRTVLEQGDAMAPAKTTPEACRERLVAELGHAAVTPALTGHRVMTVVKHWAALAQRCGERSVLPSTQVAWDALRQSFAPPAIFPAAPELAITCYGEGPAGIEQALQRLRAQQAPPPQSKRLSIWPRAPQFAGDADLERTAALCREHGVATIAIYHLGLLPWRTIERAATILRR
jgi:hypothetical protein